MLALVACAPRPFAPGVPDAPYAWTPVEAPAAPLTIPVSPFEVTYARDGELYRDIVDAATLASVTKVALGAGIAFNPIVGTESIIVDDYAGPIVVNAMGDRRRYGPSSPLPVGGISNSGVVYIGSEHRIAVVDADGNVLRSFEAPRATPGVPVVPRGYKGALLRDASAVMGFVFDAIGSFVIVDGIANSALVDLDTGRRAELAGMVALDAASRDGHAVVLGRDTSTTDLRYSVAEIDLATLDVVGNASFTTGSLGPVHHARALLTPRGDVYAYLAQSPTAATLPMSSLLVAFDTTLAPRRIALPNDLGLDATVGGDGALYLFGGPARNVVARVDPLTADIARYALAPDGAYVRALVAR